MSIQDQKYEELTALELLRQDYKQGIMSALVGQESRGQILDLQSLSSKIRKN